MSEKQATWISIFFHPVFLLAYTTLIIVFTPSLSEPINNISKKIEVFSFVVFVATILPCLLMLLLKRFRVIKSFTMETSRERWIPYIFNCLIYTLTNWFLCQYFQNSILSCFFLGMLILQIIILFVNFFWKISIHATGIGAITGLFIALALLKGNSMWWYSLLFLSLTVLIIFARLRLKAHSKMQVIIGWQLGFFLMYSIILYS